MEKYISFKDIWDIVKSFEFEGEDGNIAMTKLLKVLQSAHGRFFVIGEIMFVGDYDYLDRKWSTSVIGSENQGERVEKEKKLLDRINEEVACVMWLLDHIADEFEGWDNEYIEIFYERYFLNKSVQDITERHNINNRRYYVIMENVEYLVKSAWQLTKIPQAIVDISLAD